MTRADPVDVSVVVPVTRFDGDLLASQLEKLLAQRTNCSLEILVADNSGDLELGRVFPGVRVIAAATRRGAGHARNVAAREARGRYLLFCDADDLVAPTWVTAHVRALGQAPLTVGASRYVDDRRLGQQGDAACWSPGEFSEAPLRHEGLTVADGCNMGIHRSAFEQAGGFPEHYLRAQDVALSLRLRAIGVLPVFVPQAKVLVRTRKRSLRDSLPVRLHRGQARVLISREFDLPPRPWLLSIRAAARTVRQAGRAWQRSSTWGDVTMEAAETAGVWLQAMQPRLWAVRSRPGS